MSADPTGPASTPAPEQAAPWLLFAWAAAAMIAAGVVGCAFASWLGFWAGMLTWPIAVVPVAVAALRSREAS